MADLTIVGVEKTQAIQYFSINGQGSGYAPDNSVPLVGTAHHGPAGLHRLRAAATAGPTAPGRSRSRSASPAASPSTGSNRTARSCGWRTSSPINGSIAPGTAASIDRGEPNHTLNFRVSANDCQGQLRFTVTPFEQDPWSPRPARGRGRGRARSRCGPRLIRRWYTVVRARRRPSGCTACWSTTPATAWICRRRLASI